MSDKPMTKAEREKEARIRAFAEKARTPPLASVTSLLNPDARAALEADAPAEPAAQAAPAPAHEAAPDVTTVATPEPAKESPQEPPQAAQEPDAAPTVHEAAKTPPKARKTAPAPAKLADWQQAEPWASAHPKVTVPFMLRLPESMHMQLTYLKEHLPNTSLQKIVHEAIRDKIAQLMEEHYQ